VAPQKPQARSYFLVGRRTEARRGEPGSAPAVLLFGEPEAAEASASQRAWERSGK
jgi:hypothetical protein